MRAGIRERLRETEQTALANARRLEALSARQDSLEKLANTLAILASEQEHIKTDVQEIRQTVKTLAERPAKRWELLLEKGLGTLIAALAGYFLARLGLN